MAFGNMGEKRGFLTANCSLIMIDGSVLLAAGHRVSF